MGAFLGKGTKVTGKLVFDGTARIEGHVEGEVSAQDTLIIGEGAVVRGEIPDGAVAVGVPARVVGRVTDEQKQEWLYYKARYAELAGDRYPKGFRRIG
jgi:cytoskeletal protein CcmA (bactofilin family)